MKISVAMATYNGAAYIEDQLRSIAAQTLTPFELVLCDDRSTDETLDIVRRMQPELAFPVRIHVNAENLHFTGNFLKAASLCTGEFVAFCDQDDLWDPAKLEKCLAAMTRESADLLVHEGRVIDANGVKTMTRLPDLSKPKVLLDVPPFGQVSKGFAMVVRSQVIAEFLQGWDWAEYSAFRKRFGPPLGHDQLLYAWCVGRRRICLLQEELVLYRVHDKNVTASESMTLPAIARVRAYFRGLASEEAQYRLPSEKWLAEVQFLESYLSRLEDQPLGVVLLKEWLARNSEIWAERAGVYRLHAGRAQRLHHLLRMVGRGAYLSHKSPRLGVRALLKDFAVSTLG